MGVSQCQKYFWLDDINKNIDVNQISISGAGKYPLLECKKYLWVELKFGLAGTEEMNNVIVEKQLDYMYF